MKKYEFGFDMWGLLLFLIIMSPNFIWFAIPAPKDVLRADSVTIVVDILGSILQVVMVAALCFIRYKGDKKINKLPLMWCVFGCVIGYFVGWMLYYSGNVSLWVIMLLTVLPCIAFELFSIAKVNMVAVMSAICFMVCHIAHAVVNYC